MMIRKRKRGETPTITITPAQLLLLMVALVAVADSFTIPRNSKHTGSCPFHVNNNNNNNNNNPKSSENNNPEDNKSSCSSFDLNRWQRGDGLTSFSRTCFADYWSDLVSVAEDSGGAATATTTIDPYKFSHRMALGKYLIEHTGGEDVWGGRISSSSEHWFYGYLAQLDWQRRSGRLQDPQTWNAQRDLQTASKPSLSFCTDETVSKLSWWGYMNLNFSVAVYYGASQAGLVPPVQLSDPTVLQDLGFQECVGHWKQFWSTHHQQFVKTVLAASDQHAASTKKAALTTLYKHLWNTHTDIISSGLAHAKDLEQLLPEEDRNAGLGWCKMVELLSAMSWTLLSLDSLCRFGIGYLPTIRLAGPESVDWIKEHRPKEYVTVKTLTQLKDTPPDALKQMSWFWSRVTYWDFQRETMPLTLDALNHGNALRKVLELGRILALAMAPQSPVEAGVWVGFLSLAVYAVVGSALHNPTSR